MRKRRLAAFLLALGALAGGAALWLELIGDPDRAGYVERDPSRRVTRGALRLRSAPSEETAPPAPLWLLEPGVEGRRIAGTVLADGEPIAGATVELRSEYLLLQGGEPPSATTDGAGRFDFGRRPPTSYAVMASADGFRPGGWRINLKDPDGRPPPDQVRIELSRCDGWVFGEVRDAYGGAVTRGTVSVVARIGPRSWFHPLYEVPIEEDGSFALCRPRERQQLWVEAPGYGTVWLRGAMPAGGWEVILVSAGSVAGRVVDEAGAPIPEARVLLRGEISGAGQPPIAQTVLSRADGSFRFNGVAPGRYDLAADHGSHRVGADWPSVFVEAGGEVTGVLVRMRSCRSLAGFVEMDGEPLVGAQVGFSLETYTQSDGSFFAPCVPFEAFEFEVERHDVLEPKTVPAGTEPLDDLIVRVEPRASVSGRVTADGAPVEGAVVGTGDPAQPTLIGAPLFGESFRARTEADGSYELSGLPPGTHHLRAWDPVSERRSEAVPVEVAEQDRLAGVDLDLERAAVISGVVLDPEGTRASQVPVKVRHADSEREAGATTNEHGEFRIRGLAAGRYRPCLGNCSEGEPDPRYLPLEGNTWPEVEVPRSDSQVEVELVVRSRQGLSISGRVRYEDGTAAPFATVRTYRREGRATADEDGFFELSDLAEGTYRLSAVARDGSRGEVRGSRVEIGVRRAGELLPVVLFLGETPPAR